MLLPSLCNIGKLLRNLEKLAVLDPAPRAGLEVLGSRAGLARRWEQRWVMWKQDQQLEGGESFFFSAKNCP